MGELRGTVEAVSIRSLRVRHHRGALHTIPYGELKALTNYSRDWVIMKLEYRTGKPTSDECDLLVLPVFQVKGKMDLRPWDYWTRDGQPHEETKEILQILEWVIEQNPRHPGANHYYIHTVELPYPERGVDAADRLGALVPGAGHLVHMPSHIFRRVGRYEDASKANVAAIAVDEDYITQCRAQGIYPLAYYPHNIHFL